MGLMQLIGLGKATFSHGVHPREYKEPTDAKEIRRLPFAPEMVLPLSQHFGKPSVPIVHEGQEVVRGEPIAKADGFMSVPLHAPATGVVKKIGLMPTARGPKAEAILLELHSGVSQDVLYDLPQDVDGMGPEDIVRAVQDTGMVGLGGASFPTHVKMTVPKGQVVDTVMVNGCECEPYLTTDHRVMLEYSMDLFAGIRIAMKAVGASKAVIGVEDNKPDAIACAPRCLSRGRIRNRRGHEDQIPPGRGEDDDQGPAEPGGAQRRLSRSGRGERLQRGHARPAGGVAAP